MCPTPRNTSSTSSWRSMGPACSQVRGSCLDADGAGKKIRGHGGVGKGRGGRESWPAQMEDSLKLMPLAPVSCSPACSPRCVFPKDRFQGCPHPHLNGFPGEMSTRAWPSEVHGPRSSSGATATKLLPALPLAWQNQLGNSPNPTT